MASTEIVYCDYGCGQIATHQFKNGKWCCSKTYKSCPKIREKMSLSHLGKPSGMKGKIGSWSGKVGPMKGKKHTKQTKEKIRRKNTGKGNPSWKGGYCKSEVAFYDTYQPQLLFIEDCRRNKKDQNILEVKCAYCGSWYIPSLGSIWKRLETIKGQTTGENRLYCSNECKNECPIYNQRKYPKNYKPATSREVQPELRQMRFKLDNYTCQKCGKHQSILSVGLHCHHIEGIRWEPLESTDIDKVITLCKDCHIKVHQIDGCKYSDLQCK